MIRSSSQKGFSLIETIIYVTLFALILGAVLYSLANTFTWYRSMKASRNLELSATAILDRVMIDIRNAKTVNDGESSFNTSPGILSLVGTDDFGATRTIKFFLVNNTFHVSENGVDLGPLSLSTVRVTNLVFRSFSGGAARGIRVELTLRSSTNNYTKTANFYTSAILRGSYN